LGEIQDFGHGKRLRNRRKRRAWLSVPGNILVLPFVALVGLGLYLSGVLGALPNVGTASTVQFAQRTSTADRDCGDFATRWEAQWFYWQAGSGDAHRLDDDGDGLACEFKTWVDWSGWFKR
jgi:hypothetical protein